jgi:hypothetical protein
MKPFLSLCAIFVLFLSLILQSQAKLELAYVQSEKWAESRIKTQGPVDFFLRPDQGNKIQNFQNRNHWFPYPFNTTFVNKYSSTSPAIVEIPFRSINSRYYSTIPVFIFTGALRL